MTARRPTRWLALALTLALLAPLALPWTAQAVVQGQVGIVIDTKDIRTLGNESATSSISTAFMWTITDGAGINQANLCYQSNRTLTTGATEDLDLSGTLANIFGVAVFTGLKFIAVSAAAANTTNITVSRPTGTTGVPLFTTALGGLAPLKPGGFFAFADPSAAGVAVVAATDLITFTNSAGASATYTVIFCGKS